LPLAGVGSLIYASHCIAYKLDGGGGASRPIVISGRLWIVSGKALDEISEFIRVFNNLHLLSKLICDQSKIL
jgi:hypothetical protein